MRTTFQNSMRSDSTVNRFMKIRHFYPLLALALLSNGARSQDIHFSQVYETPLLLSPANTGFYNGYARAIVNYRNQWASMNKAFQTAGISVDGGLFKSKKRPAFMGIGFTLFQDYAGAARLSKTSALVHVSGLVKLGKKSAMSVGLAGGTDASNARYGDLTYASQFNGNTIDPAISSGEAPYRQFTAVDVAAGIGYEFTSFKRDPDHDDITNLKIVLGAYHLNRPRQEFGFGSDYRLPVRYVAAFTSVYDLEDTKFTLTPTAIYQVQGSFEEILVGSYLKFRMSTGTKVTGEKTQNAIGFGLFYRRRDALIPKIIFDLGDFSVGMAYDANVSGYRSASNGMGGFEISLRYNDLANSLFESRREFR
jgi:type IX secretion system PorP/SprF family membrane protein